MKRRIFAWVLLAGFVLLLLNVMFIKFYWQLSMILYILIAVGFLLYNNRANRARDEEKLRNSIDSEADGMNDDDNAELENSDNRNDEQ